MTKAQIKRRRNCRKNVNITCQTWGKLGSFTVHNDEFVLNIEVVIKELVRKILILINICLINPSI